MGTRSLPYHRTPERAGRVPHRPVGIARSVGLWARALVSHRARCNRMATPVGVAPWPTPHAQLGQPTSRTGELHGISTRTSASPGGPPRRLVLPSPAARRYPLAERCLVTRTWCTGVDVLTPARRAIAATRVALLATLGLGLLLTTAPVDARAGFAPPSQATRDLGTPDAGGVSQTDRFQSFGQVKVYPFAVPPGPATVQSTWATCGTTSTCRSGGSRAAPTLSPSEPGPAATDRPAAWRRRRRRGGG